MPVALADHDPAGSFSIVILSRSGNSWKRTQRFLSTLVEVCKRDRARAIFAQEATRFYLLDCCCWVAAGTEKMLPPLGYWRV
jgi:hypothetical protein